MFKFLRRVAGPPDGLSIGDREWLHLGEAVTAKAASTNTPVDIPFAVYKAVKSLRITVEQALSLLDSPEALTLISVLDVGWFAHTSPTFVMNPDGVLRDKEVRRDGWPEAETSGEVSGTNRDRAALVAEFISTSPSDPEDEDFRLGLVAVRDYLRAKGGGAFGLKSTTARAIGAGLFTVEEVAALERREVWQVMDGPGPTYVIDQDGTVVERVNIPPEQVAPSWINKERPDLTVSLA